MKNVVAAALPSYLGGRAPGLVAVAFLAVTNRRSGALFSHRAKVHNLLGADRAPRLEGR